MGSDCLSALGFESGSLFVDGSEGISLAAREADELSDFEPYGGIPNLFLLGSPF